MDPFKAIESCPRFDTSRGEVCKERSPGRCGGSSRSSAEDSQRRVADRNSGGGDGDGGGGYRKRVIVTSRLARGGKSPSWNARARERVKEMGCSDRFSSPSMEWSSEVQAQTGRVRGRLHSPSHRAAADRSLRGGRVDPCRLRSTGIGIG